MEIKTKISEQDFYNMRRSVNWQDYNLNQINKALNNSMIVVGIYENDEIIAIGRLVGDYSCKGLLTDIIVKPNYQKKGYGKIVVTKILELVKENLDDGETICIECLPTNGNRDFYINCGFEYNPNIQDGVDIWLKK